MIKYIFISLLFSIQTTYGQTPKVGLVLSGGGASALAHIGVIKALEDHHIHISYITGTSMGAVIGALYAGGIPIKAIEEYFTSKEFLEISQGDIPRKYNYFYSKPEPNASMVSLRFKKVDDEYNLLLPSNIISSEAIDLTLVESLLQSERLSGYDFDHLKIPFRCVAVDITTRKTVIFKDGSLTEALRASISYPLFVKPIKINEHLMIDGGLYNNFPVDVMCSDFEPDYIIGSNVSSNIEPPTEDDIISQLQTMLIRPTNYAIECVDGTLIEPTVNVGTFKFNNPQRIIDSGYVATLAKIDKIAQDIPLDTLRSNIEQPDIVDPDSILIGQLNFQGINENQERYVRTVFGRRKKDEKDLTFNKFKKNYFRLYQERYIEDIRTKLKFNPMTSKYDATIVVNPIKSWVADIGGNISSRSLAEGYASISYNFLSSYGFKFNVSTNYGTLYQSIYSNIRLDFPSKFPFYFKPKILLNNWNWAGSQQSNKITSTNADYIIEGEFYAGIETGTAIGNNFKLIGEFDVLRMESNYYQSLNFQPSDTSDNTSFNGTNIKLSLEANNLNKIQYPYEGTKFISQFTYTNGKELFEPGSTNALNKKSTIEHSFIQFKLDYQQYTRIHKQLRLGLSISALYSTMETFENYTATLFTHPHSNPHPIVNSYF